MIIFIKISCSVSVADRVLLQVPWYQQQLVQMMVVEQLRPGQLALSYRHWKHGSGLLVIDEETLKPLAVEKPKPDYLPKGLRKVRSDFPGMSTRIGGDSGPTKVDDSRFVLRWETLGSHRDRPREGKLPKNSDLVLYKIAYK